MFGGQTLFPEAALDSRFRGSASFLLPRHATVAIADVFETLLTRAADAGISDWGVGQVTLEDVFQAVVMADRRQR